MTLLILVNVLKSRYAINFAIIGLSYIDTELYHISLDGEFK